MSSGRNFCLLCCATVAGAVAVVWAGARLVSGAEAGTAAWGALAAGVMVALCLLAGAWLIFRGALRHMRCALQAAARGEGGLNEAHAADFPLTYAALDELRQNLKTARGLTYGILRGLPLAYLLVDTQERATSSNQACLDMLQIDDSLEDCMGKTLAELFYNDPARETAVGKSIRKGEYFRNLDVVITGHKGRRTHVLANVFPLHDAENACLGGMCLYMDMTDLKAAEQHIAEKNQRMASVAQALETAVEHLAEIARSLAQGIRQSDENAVEVSARLTEAATAMNEMNATVQEVARNAEEASSASGHTQGKASAGEQVVQNALHSIETVHEVSQALRRDMSQLDGHARAISEVMNVISDIADQTNLLALNAAIEAARAGEAGRGFAVVADEVRKLAEKTMISTQDVGDTITAIQQSACKSMASMDDAVAQVEKATAFAGQSGEALREIVSTAENTVEQVNGIAAASVEQSAASEQINRTIEQISRRMVGTSKSMTEVRQEAVRLSEVTETLEGLIDQLKA